MVAMLLKAGMDPHERRSDASPWEKIVKRLIKASDEQEQLESSWLDICKLFAMHGASIPSETFGKIQRAFSHLHHDSVLELHSILYPQKSRCPQKQGAKKRNRPSK